MDRFDLFDQAALTEVINRPLTTQWEDNPRLGDLIAPMKSLAAREAKLQTRQTLAFGMAPYRAPEATPTLYRGNQTWRTEIISLALIEEMERISEEQYLALNSSDETVRRAAGLEIVTRGRILAARNERRLEYMRWQAFTGSLTVTYPTGDEVFIDYGFKANQKVTASTLWSDTTNADPVSDLRTASNTIAANSGYYGIRHHMSSDTYDLIVRNQKVRALLTATGRSMLIPTKQDVLTLLRDGSDIVIYDNGFRAETVTNGTDRGLPNSITRFLPVGKVLTTTEYQIEGVNIAETLDGQCVVNNGPNDLRIVQGAASEVIVEPLSHNTYMRVASARIPRLIYPEAFHYMTVS